MTNQELIIRLATEFSFWLFFVVGILVPVVVYSARSR